MIVIGLGGGGMSAPAWLVRALLLVVVRFFVAVFFGAAFFGAFFGGAFFGVGERAVLDATFSAEGVVGLVATAGAGMGAGGVTATG